ncbi:PAS domain-containing protein [Francisella tularensis]|nr:PAS domain-containing protein [Francisella tularensis]MBK2227966.1 PAS domain-containing protein [Francisella tularensis]MBK2235897.1 PAS domain-containing protein [Francisella tularensis]MBK2244256.1 PAS domain-containing protein [Francisella tularensis]MBK2247619.1 PAS domain-containing protein [Francisella tularensis]
MLVVTRAVYPVVEKSNAILRITFSASHKNSDIKLLVNSFKNILKELTIMHNDISEYLFSSAFASIANISSSDIFIYLKNLDSKYVFLSNNICKLSNITHQDALGKSDIDFNWGKKQAKAFRNDDLFVINNKKNHISKYLISNDKNFLWIKTEKIPVLDKQENVIGIIGIAQDISYKRVLTRNNTTNIKTPIATNQSPATIVLELLEEYIRNNYKNEANIYDEYSFIKNSFIKKLSFELTTRDEQHFFTYINLENQLKETLSTFIKNRELIVVGDGENKTTYYNHLIVCLCFIELYKNKSLREKILINIDNNVIKLMINRAGEKSKLILDTQIISDKFIINYLTPDITKYLNLNLEIFAIDGLVAAINIRLDTNKKII